MLRVFFVGARASVASGMPLTARILSIAKTRLESAGGADLFFGPNGTLYARICMQRSEDHLANILPGITDVLSFLDLLIANEQPIKARINKEYKWT
jgi:hypothetical protein